MSCSSQIVHSYIFIGIAILLLNMTIVKIFVTRYYSKQFNTLKDVSIQTETTCFEYTICIHPNEEVSVSRNYE
jgi:hypothetical protein